MTSAIAGPLAYAVMWPSTGHHAARRTAGPRPGSMARAGVADQFDLRAGLAADRCAAFQQIGFGVGVGEAQAGRGAGADGVADPVAPVRLRERPSAASSTSCSWPTP